MPFVVFVEDENLQLSVDISSYQTLDSSLNEDNEPYSRMPGLKINWNKEIALSRHKERSYDQYSTRYSMLPRVDVEIVSFDHSSDEKTQGTRLDMQPSVSFSFAKSFLEVNPKITYAYTAYSIENQQSTKPSDPTRGIYLLEIENIFGRLARRPNLYNALQGAAKCSTL